MKGFKKFSFKSNDEQEIISAVKIFEKLGYHTHDQYFNAEDATLDDGFCTWDDGEITEGWLDPYAGFEQVTMEELKEMVGEGVKDNVFTLERLLGCEVNLHGEIGYICNTYNYHGGVVHLLIDGCTVSSKPSYLKFFTEHGDELTFDEYVQLYYPEG